MFDTTIQNPKTGRTVRVRGWRIEPRQAMALLREKHDVRALSWALLGDDESIQMMDEEHDGDSARSNFGLATFEQALDWRLGSAVVDLVRHCAQRGKWPKPFDLLVTRKGDLFYRFNSDRIVEA